MIRAHAARHARAQRPAARVDRAANEPAAAPARCGSAAVRRNARARGGCWRVARTVRLHDLQELDHHLRRGEAAAVSTRRAAAGSVCARAGASAAHLGHGADQDLLLAALLGVVDALQRVVQHRDPHHPGGTWAPEPTWERCKKGAPLHLYRLRHSGAAFLARDERCPGQAVAAGAARRRAFGAHRRLPRRRRAEALGRAGGWLHTTCVPCPRSTAPRGLRVTSARATWRQQCCARVVWHARCVAGRAMVAKRIGLR